MVFRSGRYLGFSLISIIDYKSSTAELGGGIDCLTRNIEVGVPQGSCLGPLLVLIYIYDLQTAVRFSTVSMYGDDTSLCLKSKDISQLNRGMNRDFENLDSWLRGKKLSLYVVKTRSMLIATKPRHQAVNNAAEKLNIGMFDCELDVVT